MADGQLVCDGGRERSEMLYLCTIHYSRVIYQTPACVGASAVLCGGHQRWIRSGSWATRMRHSPVCVCGACVCVCHVCSVAQSCPTLCDLMDCSPPSSSVHGTEKWSGVGCHFLLQRIFPTQGSNTLLQHQQVDYLPLGHQGRQKKNVSTHWYVALNVSFRCLTWKN